MAEKEEVVYHQKPDFIDEDQWWKNRKERQKFIKQGLGEIAFGLMDLQ